MTFGNVPFMYTVCACRTCLLGSTDSGDAFGHRSVKKRVGALPGVHRAESSPATKETPARLRAELASV